MIRKANQFAIALLFGLTLGYAGAADFSKFTTTELISGLKTTLSTGSTRAIAALGVEGGYLNNPEVKIGLPEQLEKRRKLLSMIGMGDELNNLESSMNRAAELAIPKAKTLVSQTIKNMTVEDAKSILSGGDTAVTDFFRTKTEGQLFTQLKPLIATEVNKVGLATQYNQIAGKASKYGLISETDASIETHVTKKALIGLFTVIAKEEQAIRANPVETGSKLLKKLFSR